MASSSTSKRLLVTDLISTDKIYQVPSHYIRPLSDRPNLQNVTQNDPVPLIDLSHLHGPNRAHVVQQIGQACQDHGFFQLKNHGIPESIVSNMMQIARDFFKLPEEERLKTYSDDPNKTTRLSTSFNIRTAKDEVPGLQVLRNGHWVAIDPVPNTFIINIGDQIQVLSNDKYKSILHRAVVNCDKERISITTFYCPSPDAVIRPAPELVTDDEPAVYRPFTYGEFYEKFWNRGLATENCLDAFMASPST